jgi:guanine nucleotide-binding protein G(I)/G(S)/G(T) subunit beta-1
VAFSKSGKFVYAGYDDYACHSWDTVLGGLADLHNDDVPRHENRVSCLGVSRDGKALCTGSWDTLLKARCQRRSSRSLRALPLTGSLAQIWA